MRKYGLRSELIPRKNDYRVALLLKFINTYNNRNYLINNIL